MLFKESISCQKEEEKIITGYSPRKVEWRGEGQQGRESAAASDGGGQGSYPRKRPGQEQDGPCLGVWGREKAVQSPLSLPNLGLPGIPPVGVPGGLLLGVAAGGQPLPTPTDP